MSDDHDRAAESYDNLAHYGWGWREEARQAAYDDRQTDWYDTLDDDGEETDEDARRNH